MKKLLLATILGLSMTFPLVSNAGQIVFGVDIGAKVTPVNNNVLSGHVASDSSNTLVPQKLNNQSQLTNRDQDSGKDTYIVFGIDIKNKNLI